uniref:SH3-domain GRB2-like endophilin B2b n=1 Tax=Astyanax mexicanus TaxID=7994 RepID=A0A8B9LLJ0_ASTMX
MSSIFTSAANLQLTYPIKLNVSNFAFTEEKLGQAEKTELDAHLENLIARGDCTKNWTEKIFRQTEVLLQPNPSKINSLLLTSKTCSLYDQQILLYVFAGSTLITVGEYQKKLGGSEREFLQSSAVGFLTPLRNFLEGDWRTISKERRLLENRRLDLDVCKARLKKAKLAEAKAAAEQELRVAQTEFDRQAEVTRLLLEGISSTHVSQRLRLGNPSTSGLTAGPSPLSGTSAPARPPPPSSSLESVPLKIEEVKPPATGTRKAKVLYDYDAADTSELSLFADELITVYTVPGMDPDWLVGERGNQKGKVPVTYLELLS